jgi:hypothetical protein
MKSNLREAPERGDGTSVTFGTASLIRTLGTSGNRLGEFNDLNGAQPSNGLNNLHVPLVVNGHWSARASSSILPTVFRQQVRDSTDHLQAGRPAEESCEDFEIKQIESFGDLNRYSS